MGLPLLQVSLFATLAILVSGASVSPRSFTEARPVRSGGGGGGGGGGMGGLGGGFGGGFGGGSGSSDGESPGGQMGEDNEESEEKGIGWGGGGGWGEGSSEEPTDYEEGGGDGNGAGDGDDVDGNDNGGDDTTGGGQGGGNECDDDDDDETGNEGGNDGAGDDDGFGEEEEGNNDDYSDDSEEEGGGDGSSEDNDSSGSCGDGGGGGGGSNGGDGQGWGEGCDTKSTKSSNYEKRSTKSIKSPDMGESSIPSSIWLSAGKNAPRNYYWEYYNDNNLVSGGSDGGAIHRPPQEISNIVTVIPWVLTQFMPGLTVKILPLGPMLRSLVPKYGITESHPLLRFKRDTNMMKTVRGESDESGAVVKDAENEYAGELEQEEPEDMEEFSLTEEMETAEEDPSEAGTNPDVMGAEDISSESEDFAEESPGEEGGIQEEVVEGTEVEEGGETGDEATGMSETEVAVMEEEFNILAQEAMNPAMLERAARSMERNGAEVVEDLKVAMKRDLKSVGTSKSSGDGVVSELRNTRDLLGLGGLLDSDLLNLQLAVGR